jgi:hypothetical protein
MVHVLEEAPRIQDTGSLRVLVVDDSMLEDHAELVDHLYRDGESWPAPSAHPTTANAARVLRDVTVPVPESPEISPDDNLGP